jgi:excisionase family DNA binding protein
MAEDATEIVLLTTKEVAAILTISTRKVCEIASEERKPGKLYGRRLTGRQWRFRRADLIAFLNSEFDIPNDK